MSANKNTLALVITLALTATKQEVESVIADIRDQFGLDNGVDPATLVKDATPQPQQAGNHAPTVTANTELDSEGLPWDSRIHSSSKAKNANGSWRARKGVDKSLLAKVTAELKATMGAQPAAADTAPPPVATAPAMPSLPSMPAPPTPAAPPVDPRYTNFVNLVAEHTAKGAINEDWVRDALTRFNVPEGNIQNLAHKPDLIPEIDAAFRRVLEVA